MALATRHRTARLSLRPLAAADAAAVVAGVGDLAVSQWLIPVPHPYSAADFDHFLTEVAVPGETFAITDANGFAGIMGIEDATLGYWLAPQAQGRGYATEAARCLVAAFFADGGEVLHSGHFEGNAPSARVLAKLGFVETGRDRRFCTALGHDRPHVTLSLPRAAFS